MLVESDLTAIWASWALAAVGEVNGVHLCDACSALWMYSPYGLCLPESCLLFPATPIFQIRNRTGYKEMGDHIIPSMLNGLYHLPTRSL